MTHNARPTFYPTSVSKNQALLIECVYKKISYCTDTAVWKHYAFFLTYKTTKGQCKRMGTHRQWCLRVYIDSTREKGTITYYL